MVLSSSLPFDTSAALPCPNTFDRIFTTATFVTSITLNFIFLDLIMTHTSLSIKPYKRVLMICTMCDLMASLASFLFITKVQVLNNKQLILTFDGILPLIFYKFQLISFRGLNILLGVFEMTVMFVCGYSSFIPFIYRYRLICKNKPLTNNQLISLNLFLISLCIIISMTQMIRNLFNTRGDLFLGDFKYETFQCLHLALDYNLVFEENEGLTYFIYYANYTTSYIFMSIFLSLYGLSFYCGWSIMRFLKRKKCLPATVRNNKQINLTLLVQGITPILIIGLPYMFNVLVKILKLNRSQVVFDWMIHGVSLIPCLNPIMAMLFLSCYRRVIFSKLGLSSRTSESQISSVVTVTNYKLSI